MFQSTHPRGVRPALAYLTISQLRFQSTHPRGVRRIINAKNITWGRFQSTHPRGVRQKTRMDNSRRINSFNPRTHEGCDTLILLFFADAYKFQSTHPRGVRLIPTIEKYLSDEFQSTHPRGVRLMVVEIFMITIMFQSTHPRGVRQRKVSYKPYFFSFNPRTHEGCDCTSCKTKKVIQVSIHAPTRGATVCLYIL